MKNAILLTGAAARITQEVALLDKLIEKFGLDINPDSTVLAGFSSGALNISGINGCFRKNNPASWNDYFKNQVLFPIKTEEIYTREKVLMPLNTQPLRKKIETYLDVLECKTFKDFEFETFILIFSFFGLKTIWSHNRNPKYEDADLSDLLMATSSIPIIFPEQEIRNLEKELPELIQENIDNPIVAVVEKALQSNLLKEKYADGGTAGSFMNFEEEIERHINENGKFNQIFVISPMREVSPKDWDTLKAFLPTHNRIDLDLKEFVLLKQFLSMISQNGFDRFLKQFHKWTRKHEIANEIFVSVPNLKENFPMMIFDMQKEQYDAVVDWADKNPDQLAVPIDEYVKKLK